MINRGAAAFQEAFDKRVTTLRGRRAKNREIFDKYVEDAVASGRRVDAKELASFANQISGGDSYLTGEIPQGEILTAFTDRANARVEIKEMEERFANLERNKKEANILADFQLQNFDMPEDKFIEAGKKQFGKYFGKLMQRVGGFQGLKDRNRDAIIKRVMSDTTRMKLIREKGDAKKIFPEIKDSTILATLNNIGIERSDERVRTQTLAALDYLREKVTPEEFMNPASKNAIIRNALFQAGVTEAEDIKRVTQQINDSFDGIRAAKTSAFDRAEAEKVEGYMRQARQAALKFYTSKNLSDYTETDLEGVAREILRGSGITEASYGEDGAKKYNAALSEITTTLKSRRTSDVGVRVRRASSSIPAFATTLTKEDLSDRSPDFESEWQNALQAAEITEADLGENASTLKRNFMNTLQKDRASDIAEVTRKRKSDFSKAVMGDKTLTRYLISTPASEWYKPENLSRIRKLATASGITLPEDPRELQTDPLFQNIINEANQLSRLAFRDQRQAQIINQRKAIEDRIDNDIKNTAAMVEAMTGSKSESARNIGGVIKGNNIIMTNAQAALAQTYAEEALAKAREQGEVSAAEGNNIVMAAIQKAGGRTRSQVMQSATESILGYEMDTDMLAETNKEIDSFRAALLDLPDWLRDQGEKARKAVETKMRRSYNRIKSSLQDWPNGVYKNTREAGQKLVEMERLIDNLQYAQPSPKPATANEVDFDPSQPGVQSGRGQGGSSGRSRPTSPANNPLTRQALTTTARGSGQNRQREVNLLDRVADMANNGPGLLNMDYDSTEAEVLRRLPPSVRSAFQQWENDPANRPPSSRGRNMGTRNAVRDYRMRRARALYDIIQSGNMEAQLQSQNVNL